MTNHEIKLEPDHNDLCHQINQIIYDELRLRFLDETKDGTRPPYLTQERYDRLLDLHKVVNDPGLLKIIDGLIYDYQGIFKL